MKTTHYTRISYVIMALTALIFTACKDKTNTTPDTKFYAKVMLYHGATDAVAMHLKLDDVAKTVDSLIYTKVTPYYETELTAGKKTKIGVFSTKTGALPVYLDSLLLLNTTTNVTYSIFTYQDNDVPKTVRAFITTDNLIPPTAGKGRIRFVHLIPDISTSVDVETVATGTEATIRNDFANLKFKDKTDFIDVVKGTYDVKIKEAGTKRVLFTAANIVLEEGKIYTLAARGYATGSTPRGTAITTILNK